MSPRSVDRAQREAGFSLLQGAVVFSLVGSAVAIVIPTFASVVRDGKAAEAAHELDRLHRAVVAYYNAPGPNRHCVVDSAGPTPEHPSPEAVEVRFGASDSPAQTWKALAYEPEGAVRFAYRVTTQGSACNVRGPALLAILQAVGDLDGDGELSLFERRVTIDREGRVMPDVLLFRDPVE